MTDGRNETLQGRAGIVTGAARGLGEACARRLAGSGACVVLADALGDEAEAVAASIRAGGGSAVAVAVDLRRQDHVRHMLEVCRSSFGRLDFLHQNAAIQVEKPLHQTTDDEWDDLHAVNLRALFWGAKHALVHMLGQDGGVIVNTASALAMNADPLLAGYTVMKHGVLGLTRAIATNKAYAGRGIRCNCVCPGDVLTSMQERYWAALPDPGTARGAVEAQYPGGKIGVPDDVAECVAFLVSDRARFINGAALVIDGGLDALYY